MKHHSDFLYKIKKFISLIVIFMKQLLPLICLLQFSNNAIGMEYKISKAPKPKIIDFKKVGDDSFMFRLTATPYCLTSLPNDESLISLAADLLKSKQEIGWFIEMGEYNGADPQPRCFKIKVQDIISARIEELDF